VGGAAPVLKPDDGVDLGRLTVGRLVALAAALAFVFAWGSTAGHLPDVGLWPDVLVVALLLFPVTFSVAWLALPFRESRGLFLVAIALGALSWALYEAGAGSAYNVTKLLAYVAVGFWFMGLFEVLWSITVVAAIIPVVDSLSVWRGPTKVVVEERPGLFDRISIAFRLPGENATSNIGPPDILFFALFLATAARWRLRVVWTFVTMLALLGITVAITAATERGLPALPAIALGFLIPNADLLWRDVRAARTTSTQAREQTGP
jgi:hypothetical protein